MIHVGDENKEDDQRENIVLMYIVLPNSSN